MIKLYWIFIFLSFASRTVRAANDQQVCREILSLESIEERASFLRPFETKYLFSRTLNIAKYTTRPEKNYYIQQGGIEGWNKVRGPHPRQVHEYFSAEDIKDFYTEARRRHVIIDIVIKNFFEVKLNYRFDIYEMGDAQPRIPTNAQVFEILRLAENLNINSEILFEDFSSRIESIDSTKTDSTSATIAEVLAHYGP